MTLPSTAKEAMQLGEKYYFTGKPCKHGHISKRTASARECVECAKIKLQKYEKSLKRTQEKAEYFIKNKDYIDARIKVYTIANIEKVKQYSKQYREINKQKLKTYNSEWAKSNAGMATARARKHQLAKLQRTPKWVDSGIEWVIKEVYDLAALRTKVHGFSWHVDHIVPLQGKLVSGLHIPENLQVISAVENMRKRNTFIIS